MHTRVRPAPEKAPTRPIHHVALATLLATVATGAAGQEHHPMPAEHAQQQENSNREAEHRRHQSGHGAHHNPHGMKHAFDDAERWSQVFDDPERDAWQKPGEVVSLMDVGEGMTVVDLGAGTGYFLGHLAAAVGPQGEVVGLDVEPSMIEFVRQRAEREGWSNVTARVIPADDPELDAQSVDRILVVNTWHHLGDRPAYAARLAAALRPGGEIFVVDYEPDSPHGPPRQFKLPAAQIVAELEQRGALSAELIDETLPQQFVVRARLRGPGGGDGDGDGDGD